MELRSPRRATGQLAGPVGRRGGGAAAAPASFAVAGCSHRPLRDRGRRPCNAARRGSQDTFCWSRVGLRAPGWPAGQQLHRSAAAEFVSGPKHPLPRGASAQEALFLTQDGLGASERPAGAGQVSSSSSAAATGITIAHSSKKSGRQPAAGLSRWMCATPAGIPRLPLHGPPCSEPLTEHTWATHEAHHEKGLVGTLGRSWHSSGCEAMRGMPPRTHFSRSPLLPLPRLLFRSLKACSATAAVLQAG